MDNMDRQRVNEIQRKYLAKRRAEGWKQFSTLLPVEVFLDLKKHKQLRMAEWTIRQLNKV